jgi:hypothetical protein
VHDDLTAQQTTLPKGVPDIDKPYSAIQAIVGLIINVLQTSAAGCACIILLTIYRFCYVFWQCAEEQAVMLYCVCCHSVAYRHQTGTALVRFCQQDNPWLPPCWVDTYSVQHVYAEHVRLVCGCIRMQSIGIFGMSFAQHL